MSDKKGYYAFIPANVRYDSELSYAARLMYGEVSALCNEKGYCWATNSYFAELYEVDDRTIRRWISLLVEKGYLKIQLEGNRRRLYLAIALQEDRNVHPDRIAPLPGQDCPADPDRNVHQNIKSNTKKNTTTADGSDSTPSTIFKPPQSGGSNSKFDMEYLGSNKLTASQLKRIIDSKNWTEKDIQEMLDYFAFDVQSGLLIESVMAHAEMFTRVLVKGSPWKKPAKYIHPREKWKRLENKRKYQEQVDNQVKATQTAKSVQDAVFQPLFEKWRSQYSEEEQYQMALKQGGAVHIKRDHKNNITQLLRNYFRETSEGKRVMTAESAI